MPGRTFSTATDQATVTFDFDQSSNWQVTLGGNRALTLAGGQEGDEVNILLIQDGTGSRVPLWPTNVSFAAGQAPNLTTIAGGTDLVTLVKRGSVWTDKAGAPAKLPSRIGSGALSTIALVGATASIILNLSGGNGQGTGSLQAASKVFSNSGAQLLTQIDGTGSLAVGSGSIVAGSLATRPAQTVTSVVLKGVPSDKSLAGTGTIILNGSKGGATCYADTDGVGYTKCTANNGTQTCAVATGRECL